MSFLDRPIDAKETALLGPGADALPDAVKSGAARPPVSDGSGADRERLKAAIGMLGEAGFTLQDGVMMDAQGQPLTFEIFVTSAEHAKIGLAYSETARLIGIEVRVRQVESTQYWNAMKAFDFDSTIFAYNVSASRQ